MTVEKILAIILRTDASQMSNGLKKAQGDVSSFASGIKNAAAAIAGFLATSKLLNMFEGMVEGAAEEESSIKRIQISVENLGLSFKSIWPSIDGTIKRLQFYTAFSDGEMYDALNSLINLTGDYQASLNLLPHVLNLAASRQISASEAAQLLGRVTDETIRRLGMMFPIIKQNVDAYAELHPEVNKAAYFLQLVNQQTSGQAAGQLEVYGGELKNLKDNFSELGDVVGNYWIPIFDKWLKKLTGATEFGLPIEEIQKRELAKLEDQIAKLKEAGPEKSFGERASQFLLGDRKAFESGEAAAERYKKMLADLENQADLLRTALELEKPINDAIPPMQKLDVAAQKSAADIEEIYYKLGLRTTQQMIDFYYKQLAEFGKVESIKTEIIKRQHDLEMKLKEEGLQKDIDAAQKSYDQKAAWEEKLYEIKKISLADLIQFYKHELIEYKNNAKIKEDIEKKLGELKIEYEIKAMQAFDDHIQLMMERADELKSKFAEGITINSPATKSTGLSISGEPLILDTSKIQKVLDGLKTPAERAAAAIEILNGDFRRLKPETEKAANSISDFTKKLKESLNAGMNGMDVVLQEFGKFLNKNIAKALGQTLDTSNEMANRILNSMNGLWNSLYDLADEGTRKMMNFFSGITNSIAEFATGNFIGGVVGVISSVIGAISGESDAEEKRRQAIENITDEMYRNIDALEQMTDAQRNAREAELSLFIAQYQAMINMLPAGTVPEWQAQLDAYRQELDALNGQFADDATLRGIKAFGQAMNYVKNPANNLDMQKGQQLIGQWTEMFNLTAQQQIDLWTNLEKTLMASGNLTYWQQMSIEENIKRLKDQANQAIEENRQSQIVRSVTTITENQANLMLGVLNTISLYVKKIFDKINGTALPESNPNIITLDFITQGQGNIIINTLSSIRDITQNLLNGIIDYATGIVGLNRNPATKEPNQVATPLITNIAPATPMIINLGGIISGLTNQAAGTTNGITAYLSKIYGAILSLRNIRPPAIPAGAFNGNYININIGTITGASRSDADAIADTIARKIQNQYRGRMANI